MRCMFPRVRYQCQLKECCSLVDMCLTLDLTSRYDQPVGASYYSQWSFSANLLTPKDGGSSTLEILTNRSHQVDSRILCSPCFVLKILCKMKPGGQCWMYTQVINLPVLGGYCFGQGGNPGSSVVWKSSGPWWSMEGDAVRRWFFKKLSRLWESYQMDNHALKEKEV